jgi:hypothetical protein
MRQIQLKQKCAVFIGRARFKKSQLIIKYFLNSNSAGANFTLATTVACAVYSDDVASWRQLSTLGIMGHSRQAMTLSISDPSWVDEENLEAWGVHSCVSQAGICVGGEEVKSLKMMALQSQLLKSSGVFNPVWGRSS